MTLVALLTPVLALLLVAVMQRLELQVLSAEAGGPDSESAGDDLHDDTLGEEIELLTGVIASVGDPGRHLTDPEVDQALGLEPDADTDSDSDTDTEPDTEPDTGPDAPAATDTGSGPEPPQNTV